MGASVSHGVSVDKLAFAGTHCTYPWRDGQAELTWVAGYIPRWFTCLPTDSHPSTNWAQHSLSLLIQPMTLPGMMSCHMNIEHCLQKNLLAFANVTRAAIRTLKVIKCI